MTRAVLVMIVWLAACGGPEAPREDEVTETWTEGDDEPLEPEPAPAQSKR